MKNTLEVRQALVEMAEEMLHQSESAVREAVTAEGFGTFEASGRSLGLTAAARLLLNRAKQLRLMESPSTSLVH